MAAGMQQRTFVERMHDLLDVTEYRKMNTSEDREAVFRLRYDAYRREEFIEPNEEGTSVDSMDDKPNATTYGIFIAGELAGSIRISILTEACPHSPSMVTYSHVLMPMLERGMVLIDPTRFVANERLSKEFPELPYLTLRVPTMACEHYLADECLSVIRTEHAAFYKRVYRSRLIGEPCHHPTVTFPIQLMSTTVDEIRNGLYQRYPFFRSNYLERRSLFGPSSLMPGIEEGRTQLAA